MPFGYGLWTWFANNKLAQIILGLGVAYLVMRWKEEADERRGRMRERERWRAAQIETDRRAEEAITRTTEEEASRADEALTASQPSGDYSSGRLPERAFGAPERR